MRVQVNAGPGFSASEERLFERRIARLQRRLVREDGDHVTLTVQTAEEPRTGRFTGATRLALREEVLIARRSTAAALSTLLTRMFDDLERQVGDRAARRRAVRRTVEIA
jgi:hypothetical protein